MADLRWVGDWCRVRAAEHEREADGWARHNPPWAAIERGTAAGLRRAAELIDLGFDSAALLRMAGKYELSPYREDFGRGLVAGLTTASEALREQEQDDA